MTDNNDVVWRGPDELRALLVPIGQLTPDPANANTHPPKNLAAIRGSLAAFGQQKPVVVAADTGVIVAGNGLWSVLQQPIPQPGPAGGLDAERWTHVAAVRSDLPPAQLVAYGVTDNRTGELAEWDLDVLASHVGGMQADGIDLATLGWDNDDIAKLLDDWDVGDEVGDDDRVPNLGSARVDVGDVWLLGRHRLVCGDATDSDAVAAATGGDPAVCVWTDPPYGVGYVGKTADGLTIDNDDLTDDELRALLDGAFKTVTVNTIDGAAVYVAHPPGRLSVLFGQVFMNAGWRFHETLVWVKGSMVLGHSDYHPGGGRRGRGGDGWYGDNSQTTVLEYPKPSRSEAHPTMKPVALVAHCLRNSSPPGGVVLDPFAGSGSTLIAAHDLGRTAALVELDPRYVDVICRRWQAHTDTVPVLEATGEPRDFSDDG